MKILSWNVNGLRAVRRKGFLEWLEKSRPDIICLQETKIQENQIPFDLLYPLNHHSFFSCAQKKGYSGTAIYSQPKPLEIKKKLGLARFDQEGRFLQLTYPQFTLINLYLPHGGRNKENLVYKLQAYNRLFSYLKKIKDKNLILVGDFNTAHQEIDLARPKENQNNIMFTPQEREQLDKLVNSGFTDTFRRFHQGNGHYTWWSYANDARERNLGWRIDYAFVSQPLRPKLKNAFILPKVTGSDHCPIGIEIA